jgi:small subunit ribosomal protein S6
LQHDYEILLMLDPELPEARQDEIIERIRELIEKGGGTWVGHDPWGRRKLAFEIDKKTDGIYHLLQFDAEPETLDELTRILKITDGVMRHLATRRIKGGHGPGRPGPEAPVESAGREPEYAAANIRSQNSAEQEAEVQVEPEAQVEPAAQAVEPEAQAVEEEE